MKAWIERRAVAFAVLYTAAFSGVIFAAAGTPFDDWANLTFGAWGGAYVAADVLRGGLRK